MSFVSAEEYTRSLKAMGYAVRSPSLLKEPFKEFVKNLYRIGALKRQNIDQKSLEQLLDVNQEVKLQSCTTREGNVSSFELMALALAAANCKPLNSLEIGTFDGTTTLQIALNAPLSAEIHTIDLPPGQVEVHLPLAKPDLKFINDSRKLQRKYRGTSVERKVVQHLGDSTTYDFNQFVKNRLIDFCFIDAGHSYECVKSDTEKTLKILAPKGIVFWHDFDPNCPGVYRYLCELAKTLPLVHIEGTTLVVYFRSDKH